MIENPSKDPVDILLGILVLGILVFLAYRCSTLSNALNENRAELAIAAKEGKEEIWKSRAVSIQNQREILQSREISKQNSAAIKNLEDRLNEIHRKISEFRSATPG